MNILYIIGNGFDLAQGLKTSYADFYPYYLQCDSPNEAVKQLKKEIKEDVGDWSDLELALGRFSKEVASERVFTELYFDLSERLSDYLSLEVDKKQFTRDAKISGDLFMPHHYLEPLDIRNYLSYYKSFSVNNRDHNHVNVITLNYTDTLEKLVGFSTGGTTTISGEVFSIDGICHRHGVLGDTILLGVDNEEQILNESFRQNQSVKDLLVKPSAINSMRSDNDLICKEMINKAHVIVLFGVSLGATDACLWKAVVDRLSSKINPLLVYFYFTSDHIPQRRKQLLGIKEAEARKFLYERMEIPEDLRSNSRIMIGYDKDVFKPKTRKANEG